MSDAGGAMGLGNGNGNGGKHRGDDETEVDELVPPFDHSECETTPGIDLAPYRHLHMHIFEIEGLLHQVAVSGRRTAAAAEAAKHYGAKTDGDVAELMRKVERVGVGVIFVAGKVDESRQATSREIDDMRAAILLDIAKFSKKVDEYRSEVKQGVDAMQQQVDHWSEQMRGNFDGMKAVHSDFEKRVAAAEVLASRASTAAELVEAATDRLEKVIGEEPDETVDPPKGGKGLLLLIRVLWRDFQQRKALSVASGFAGGTGGVVIYKLLEWLIKHH